MGKSRLKYRYNKNTKRSKTLKGGGWLTGRKKAKNENTTGNTSPTSGISSTLIGNSLKIPPKSSSIISFKTSM